MLFRLNPFAKTQKGCDCQWLSRAADDPENPIVFDNKMNEYHLIYTRSDGGRTESVLRHCPFCGGKAPESKRGSFFEALTDSEMQRLGRLTRKINTLEDVLREFGEPDADYPQGRGTTVPGRTGQPDQFHWYRMLRYNNLSETATVMVTVYHSGEVDFAYSGKPKRIEEDRV